MDIFVGCNTRPKTAWDEYRNAILEQLIMVSYCSDSHNTLPA